MDNPMDARIGKYPAVAVFGAGALLFIGYRYWQSSRAVGTPAVDPTAIDPSTDPSLMSSGDPLSAAGSLTSGGAVPGAGLGSGITNNQDWAYRVKNYLISIGIDPINAETAIDGYLNGTPLTPALRLIVQQALELFGVPPEGVADNQTPTAPPPAPPAPRVIHRKPKSYVPPKPAKWHLTRHRRPVAKPRTPIRLVPLSHLDSLHANHGVIG